MSHSLIKLASDYCSGGAWAGAVLEGLLWAAKLQESLMKANVNKLHLNSQKGAIWCLEGIRRGKLFAQIKICIFKDDGYVHTYLPEPNQSQQFWCFHF